MQYPNALSQVDDLIHHYKAAQHKYSKCEAFKELVICAAKIQFHSDDFVYFCSEIGEDPTEWDFADHRGLALGASTVDQLVRQFKESDDESDDCILMIDDVICHACHVQPDDRDRFRKETGIDLSHY